MYTRISLHLGNVPNLPAHNPYFWPPTLCLTDVNRPPFPVVSSKRSERKSQQASTLNFGINIIENCALEDVRFVFDGRTMIVCKGTVPHTFHNWRFQGMKQNIPPPYYIIDLYDLQARHDSRAN